MTADPLFDPSDPAFTVDPYPTYARLRAEAPVHRSDLGFWIVSRYDDVLSLLKDPRGSRENWRHSPAWQESHRASEAFESWVRSQIQFLDPPDHTRQRTLVARAFTPRAIERWRPRMRALVDSLLAPHLAAGTLDVVADLARPLPYRVILELVGLPPDDPRLSGDWTAPLVRGLSTIVDADDMARAAAALDAASAAIGAVVEERRRSPADDVLSALVHAEEDGERLTHDELIANVIMLFIAGSETTTNLIANGVASLLRFPEQLSMLRARPELLPNAVEEMLRFESPAQFQSRTAIEEIELHGETIAPGDLVFLGLGSANHDPDRWDRPDELAVDRSDLHHVAFGFGIHHCLGSSLARTETEIALGRLLELDDWRLDEGDLRWGGAAAISQRGLAGLRLAFAAPEG